ncbi:riboflavin synthase subunit alpha [Endozoicomonas sp. G2_1]|uniref:riboflavin synthase subunit alpha n=1 Tax=Endozoicomonas sp. G2_1 TaxID=2821091 RepID=UPI001ADCF66E|nr:riboflavin synthase subunit alpha [Endozoicomonas sp. G2_1]MBO9492290.1 riboflavin synthase subunit alpha [Endozoicomonas sp. G2_1]
MFTGIVQSQAEVLSINQRNNFINIRVAVDKNLLQGLETGASVANNGVCLTAVNFTGLSSKTGREAEDNQGFIEFDVIDETLRVTNLGQLTVGDKVNIERSMKVGDEIGGHMVSGHIHTQAKLLQRIVTDDNCELVFGLDGQWQKYIFAKGFIGLNGASLTIGKVTDGQFSVHLIPETLSRTNLGTLEVGQSVNIEFDQQTMTIVETIERMREQKTALFGE